MGAEPALPGAGRPRARLRQGFSPSDHFHWIVDHAIRRSGGPGNIGQLRVRLGAPLPDAQRLALAWAEAGARLWPLGARRRSGLGGQRWVTTGPADLRLEAAEDQPLDRLATAHLRDGLDPHGGRLVRLGYAGAAEDPGVVLTWDHQLCDARGAMGLLAALDDPTAGAVAAERWWVDGYRAVADLPAGAAERGRAARASNRLLDPLRRAPMWRAPGGRNGSSPLAVHAHALGAEATARCDARQRAATGRFSETPYLLACVAAALEQALGQRGDLLFPLAVDQREAGAGRLLANCHAFLMLGLPAGAASRDLGEAGRLLKEAHRAWTAEGGVGKLMAALSWFPWIGYRLGQAQLGFNKAGLAASCLIANTGRTLLPAQWLGGALLGVDHVVAVPGNPGLAVLFRRDGRGLGFDVIASGKVATLLPPRRLSALIAHQLVDQPFTGAP